MTQTFKALVVEETEKGKFSRKVKERSVNELPQNNVLVNVHYSALNYKDALSATGNKGVTKNYPHTPGIDASGVVAESSDEHFSTGDKVLVTGFDLGMNTDGGFGEYIRVPGDWIVPLPDGLSLKESMMMGTAGFTAAYGVYQIINYSKRGQNTSPASDKPEAPASKEDVLVTGATGGVGSLGASLLAVNGYNVIAATGKMDQKNYLKNIGVSKVIHRDEVYADSNRPLLSRSWDAVLDTVGGEMLDAVIRQTNSNGTVACCGNILGGELHTSIYPFILRGVNLAGINSATCPRSVRNKLWQLLADNWKPDTLETISRDCSLEDLNEEIDKILEGRQVGKVLLDHSL